MTRRTPIQITRLRARADSLPILVPALVDFIKKVEGCELTAYRDTSGHWTIGAGHTGPDVIPGLTITQLQADALLTGDLKHAESAVTNLVRVPLTSNQRIALISFVFNLGATALKNSTLLKLLNKEDYAGAAKQFSVWNHEHRDGKLVETPGLTNRRKMEADLFNKPFY